MKKYAFILLLLTFYAPPVLAQELKVLNNTGSAQVITVGNQMVSLDSRDSVQVGETVMVAGRGTVTLATPDGTITITANEKSLVKNQGKDSAGKLDIDVPKGVVTFKIVPGNKLDVKTPHMVASVRGTKFTADVGSTGTDLSVSEGVVECSDNGGEREQVSKGARIKARKHGFTTQAPAGQGPPPNRRGMRPGPGSGGDGRKQDGPGNPAEAPGNSPEAPGSNPEAPTS